LEDDNEGRPQKAALLILLEFLQITDAANAEQKHKISCFFDGLNTL
jgi:hypothetical protein